MTAYDYDRVLANCLREIEAEIVRLVEREFENLAGQCRRAAVDRRLAVSRLRARRAEAAGGRGITRKAVVQVRGPAMGAAAAVDRRGLLRAVQRPASSSNRRASLVGALWASTRGMQGDLALMTRFEVFCANELAPAPSPA